MPDESSRSDSRKVKGRSSERCSFCDKSKNEVSKLIAGPTAFICDSCVFICLDILREDGVAAERIEYTKQEDTASFLSRQYGVQSWSDFEKIDPSVIELVSAADAKKYRLVPVYRRGEILTVAMADPRNVLAIDNIGEETGLTIQPVVASEKEIKNAIEKHYGDIDLG
jgi:hypothetical protein